MLENAENSSFCRIAARAAEHPGAQVSIWPRGADAFESRAAHAGSTLLLLPKAEGYALAASATAASRSKIGPGIR